MQVKPLCLLLEKRQRRLARAASAKDVLTVLIVEVTGAQLLLGFQPLVGKTGGFSSPQGGSVYEHICLSCDVADSFLLASSPPV